VKRNTNFQIINEGAIGVIPTDTLYGLVGSAFNKSAVERIYKVRKRDLKKPFIILIDSISWLADFGIKNPPIKILEKLWPSKITVILPCSGKKHEYLHRGTKKLAFRLPKDKNIIKILKQTGPLVAPSANISGQPPATTIKEAKKYFNDLVDFYMDGGKIVGEPSTIIEIDKKGRVKLVREGATKIKMLHKFLHS
jgi:L-threonylcarbamoyladenylate synthase